MCGASIGGQSGHGTTWWMSSNSAAPRCAICVAICGSHVVAALEARAGEHVAGLRAIVAERAEYGAAPPHEPLPRARDLERPRQRQHEDVEWHVGQVSLPGAERAPLGRAEIGCGHSGGLFGSARYRTKPPPVQFALPRNGARGILRARKGIFPGGIR